MERQKKISLNMIGQVEMYFCLVLKVMVWEKDFRQIWFFVQDQYQQKHGKFNILIQFQLFAIFIDFQTKGGKKKDLKINIIYCIYDNYILNNFLSPHSSIGRAIDL